MTRSNETTVPVDLPARSWSVIDAMMDNVARNSMFEYDPEAEQRGTMARAIRQAG